jgi:hypothetical protein
MKKYQTKSLESKYNLQRKELAMSSTDEVRQRFEREKKAYWSMREKLLKDYYGKWVAVVNEQVVAVGDKMGKVMEEAYRKTKSNVMFVSEVGYEDRVRRIRQVASGNYDRSQDPVMPTITAQISDIVETVSVDTDFHIDTGADLTVLRSDVALQLNLFDSPAGYGYIGGVGSKPERR